MNSHVFDRPATGLFWIALLRIMVGLMFLTTWGSNLRKGYYTADGLLHFFTVVFPQTENPLRFYAGFLADAILPARAAFAPFQLVAEGALGLALLAGFLTPLASLAGAFFLVNIFLATFGHDWPWAYLMPLSLLGVFYLTRAGRSLGVDAWLARRFGEPQVPLW
jgi:uncharacterized membrane protein YphA (DoxX/SURF4 family)